MPYQYKKNNNIEKHKKTTQITNVSEQEPVVKITKKKSHIKYSVKYGYYYGNTFDIDNNYC